MWIQDQTVDNNNFASLDVTNLYGNVPRKDGDNYSGLFTVLREFFQSHASEQEFLKTLFVEDFVLLVDLALNSETVLYKGEQYKQVDALAMGNPLAPQLAIIYMDSVEKIIHHKTNSVLKWKRYIDDVFVIWPSEWTIDNVLEVANSVCPKIKFTSEVASSEGCLPFLDCEVIKSDGRFETRLFSKSVHSGTILPWSSHVPVSVKRAVLLGELHRADARATNSDFVSFSKNAVVKRFLSNGYPRSFIRATLRQHDTAKKIKLERSDDPCNKRTFLRVPFVSEEHKRRCLALLRRSGLADHIHLWFDCGKTLRRIFHPIKEHLKCAPGCNTCPLNVSKVQQCFQKNVIYEISCTICSKMYIGESCRTIYLRIKEHLNVNNSSSAVVQHFTSEHPKSTISFTWRVLHGGLNIYTKRLISEAHYISQVPAELLMNGCNGRNNCLKF